MSFPLTTCLAYSTPPAQVDRALFWGVSIAVVLRLAFFGVGTEILNLGFVARCFFGLALIYSGIKTLRDSDGEEEDDPRENPLVRCIARLLPVHDSYDSEAAFFIRVPDLQHKGPQPVALGIAVTETLDTTYGADGGGSPQGGGSGTMHVVRGSLKVTPLFLVVVTLGVIDVIFAVDSVTAKISSASGLDARVSFFLNLTSSALAMFVLRSLYTFVGVLSRTFRLLNCGVGAVLVLIGAKLMLSGLVEIDMLTSCAVILCVLAASILASVLLPVRGAEAMRVGCESGTEEAGCAGAAPVPAAACSGEPADD